MQQEQDRDLEQALACYRLKDDPAADAALLERIVSVASAMPVEMPRPFLQRLLSAAWMADAVAFACVAMLGFWIGAVSPQGTARGDLTTAAVSSTDAGEMDQMVFGAQSWREVSL